MSEQTMFYLHMAFVLQCNKPEGFISKFSIRLHHTLAGLEPLCFAILNIVVPASVSVLRLNSFFFFPAVILKPESKLHFGIF